MGVLQVERVSGWSGVRVTWPVPEGTSAADYFGALLPAYTREGDAVSVAAAGAWVADVALHADLIARPARLGLAEGAVTVADRAVPLRVGVELPPALVMPVTAARLRAVLVMQGAALELAQRELANVSEAMRLRWWPLSADELRDQGAAAEEAEKERRRYFLALCHCIREATYDVVLATGAAERSGGVALGPLAGGRVLMIGAGAAPFFDAAKSLDADVASPARERARREKIATAARAYVARLAAYEASGRRELPEASDVERSAASDVQAAWEAEWEIWGARGALGNGERPTSASRGASGFKLGTVGKLAVGLLVVKTVLAD